MSRFSINLRGRVNNFKLPKNQPLIPLFEAIVNSIHAIDERRNRGDIFDACITIKIIRDGTIKFDDDDDEKIYPIHSFEIIDNGIGFNDPNFASFMESDSTYKSQIGGKGVGRFSWLVAFEKAQIESIFFDDNHYVKRNFEFSVEQPEINDAIVECEDSNIMDNCTTVCLKNCVSPYLDNLPKQGNAIATRIIQHCLVYFITKNCPQINLIDKECNDNFNLNQIFENKIHSQGQYVEVHIGKEVLNLLHFKVDEYTFNSNKLYLCAHNRLVETKELSKYIANLDREIYNRNNFWYIGVLSGKYLDERVDMNRLSFDIPDGGSLESMMNIITMDQIMKAVAVEINNFLKDYLQPIAESKRKRILEYTTNKAPQYRHLMKYMSEDIDKIGPNLSDDKLDDELYRIKRKFDRGIIQENQKLFNNLNKGIVASEEYIKVFDQQIEKITSANSAALAEYVAHRKAILDLMEFFILKKDDGHFQQESRLHNLIYPMRTTSSEIPYSNHNLWLIDEKLAYCSYISSDIPFDNNPKEDRTDLMILDNPVAVSDEENCGREYESIVLFELKRPMRDDYSDSDNPVSQLYKYVKKLKSNNAKDKNGRLIRVGENTRFYLYAVCDITNSLEEILDIHDFTQMPDKMGYYRYNDKLSAYIEILSYNKIINDAKKRNKILFDKLGI